MPARRVLLLGFDTYGDLTLRQPLIARLLDAGDAVSLCVRAQYADLAPFLDARLETITTAVNPYASPGPDTIAQMNELRDRIRALDPQVIVAPAYDRSYLDDWLLGEFPEPVRVGFFERPLQPWTSQALATVGGQPFAPRPGRDQTLGSPPHERETVRNARLLHALLGVPADVPPHTPVLTVGETARDRAREILASRGLAVDQYAILCPAGTVTTRWKEWPADTFAPLVVHLRRQHGLRGLLVGVGAEAAHLEEVRRRAGESGAEVETWIGAAGELDILLGLVSQGRLYVGSDSGVMHFAAALQKPVVAQFGGGHWPRFLPAARRSFVATQRLPCFGCGWNCWMDRAICASSIPADTFAAGIDWILGSAPDEQRIHEGEELGDVAAATIRHAAAHHRKVTETLHQRILEVAGHAEERARALERASAESDARLQAIEWLQGELAAARARLGRRGVRILQRLGLA